MAGFHPARGATMVPLHRPTIAPPRTFGRCRLGRRAKATANQFRLVIHAAAYWLLHSLRGLAPKTSFWRDAQFDTIRLALIKVAGRVTEMVARVKIALPSSYPHRHSLALLAARAVKAATVSHGAACPARASLPQPASPR